MSGSDFAMVRTRGMCWCLRRWPVDFEKSRLSFMHRVLRHAQNQGFSGVPKLAVTTCGETVLDLNGLLFDAQEWIKGAPLSGKPNFGERTPNVVASPEPGTLANLADALGRFHCSSGSLEHEKGDGNTSLHSWVADLRRYSAVEYEHIAAGVEERAEGEERDVARRWLALLPGVLSSAEMFVKEHETIARRTTTICHGDLWASHVYFSGTEFVGFTDFESLHRGSPALDLAQLVLHFGGWEVRDVVLDAYDRVSSLKRENLATLPIAAAVDLAFEGYWSISSLYLGSFSLTRREKSAHEANLKTLLRSLELVVRELR